MVRQKRRGQKGGNVAKSAFPLPLIYQNTYGSNRAQAYNEMVNSAQKQNNINNHIHNQNGGFMTIPQLPTNGVKASGPGLMQPNNQIFSNVNNHLQADANRVCDACIDPNPPAVCGTGQCNSQVGGKQHKKSNKSKKIISKRTNKRTNKRGNKSRKQSKRVNKSQKHRK